MDEEKKRGGKRTGSGRPKGTVKSGASSPENRYQFRLPEVVARWLDSKGGSTHAKSLVERAWKVENP